MYATIHPCWPQGEIYVRIKYKGRGNVCQLHNVGQYIATGTPETSMGESLPSVVQSLSTMLPILISTNTNTLIEAHTAQQYIQ